MKETETLQKETGEKKRTKRLRTRTVIALICAVVLTAAALTVVFMGGGLSLDGVRRTWEVLSGSSRDATYIFETGFDDAFTDLSGGIVVACGSSGVAVYGSNGEELARDAFSAKNPAITSGTGLAIAYDIGGRGLRIADRNGIVASMMMESDIISCSVGGAKGVLSGGTVFAVCTQGSGEYKGQVVFYQLNGSVPEKIYEWFSGEGYVLAAAVAPGNDGFAVLTITPRGGRIVLLDRDSTDIRAEYVLSGAVIHEMAYMQSGTLIARSSDSLISIDKYGAGTVIGGFEGRTVGGYSHEGDLFLAVYFEQPQGDAGNSTGELLTLDEKGRELGRMRTSRTLVWIYASGDRLAVLWSDGLDLYDRGLKLVASYPDASGSSYAFPRGGKRAVALGSREGKSFSGQTQ